MDENSYPDRWIAETFERDQKISSSKEEDIERRDSRNNHHGQIRESFRYPHKHWRTLAEWQIQLVPPYRHVFQVLENLLIENAIWPFGVENPDQIAN